MAIVQWVIAMAFAVRHRMVYLLPVLVMIGGFSAMYFWNQSITPDHFWAIRRFMPIILPAAIVLAASLGWMIVSRVPSPWRRVLIGVAALALAVQSYLDRHADVLGSGTLRRVLRSRGVRCGHPG